MEGEKRPGKRSAELLRDSVEVFFAKSAEAQSGDDGAAFAGAVEGAEPEPLATGDRFNLESIHSGFRRTHEGMEC